MTEMVQHERPEAIKLRMECLQLAFSTWPEDSSIDDMFSLADMLFDYMAKHYDEYQKQRYELESMPSINEILERVNA